MVRLLFNALETRKIQAEARPRGKEEKNEKRELRANWRHDVHIERKYYVPQDRDTLVMCAHVVCITELNLRGSSLFECYEIFSFT